MGALLGQLLLLIIYIALAISFLSTLADTIRIIRTENRHIDPMKVWHMLIPIYNFYYYFIVVKKVSGSIAAEFNSRNIPIGDKPTYISGVSSAFFRILSAILQVLVFFDAFNEAIQSIVALISIIIWVVYWIQVYQFKKIIKNLPDELATQTNTLI